MVRLELDTGLRLTGMWWVLQFAGGKCDLAYPVPRIRRASKALHLAKPSLGSRFRGNDGKNRACVLERLQRTKSRAAYHDRDSLQRA